MFTYLFSLCLSLNTCLKGFSVEVSVLIIFPLEAAVVPLEVPAVVLLVLSICKFTTSIISIVYRVHSITMPS